MANVAYAQPPTPMVHDCTVQRKKTAARARVMPVPPEEFGISRFARDMQNGNYMFHRPHVTEGELIKQGFDAQQVKELPTFTINWAVEEIDRDTVNENQYAPNETQNTSARLVDVIEHYCRCDYKGDGNLKIYKVTTGGPGGPILRKTFVDDDGSEHVREDIEEMDFFPFAGITPVPQTHRFFGRSMADLVIEIQKIKTALMRGLLDNTYLRNNPRPEVAEQLANSNTLDDLMVARIGAPIRVKQPGGINWAETPDVSSTTIPLLDYMDQVREMRTGVTRQGQGIDSQALQNQSATAVNQTYTMSQARMRLIARIFAETGIKDLFWLLHATIRKHGQQQETVRLRNKWTAVDPRNWKTRDDLTVHVGLGHGSQAQEIANANMLGQWQQMMLQAGMIDVVQKKNVYNTATKLGCRALKIKNPDLYFTDPDSPEAKQAAAQQAQAAAQKVDPKVQAVQIQQQGDIQKMQLDAQLKQQQMQIDTQHQAAKNTAEAALAEKKFQLERDLKLIDAELKVLESERQHQYKLAELGMQAVEHDQSRQDTQERKMQTDKLQGHIAALHQNVADIQAKHTQDVAELQKAIKAPRIRTPIRDAKGKLIGAKDEIANG